MMGSRRLRLALITGSFPPEICGVGDYSARLAENLAQWCDVQVITSCGEGGSVAGGLTVHRVMNSWALGRLPFLVSLIRKIAPDVIHIQYPTRGYGAGTLPYIVPLLGRLMGKPSVQTWHERPALRRFLLNALPSDTVIVVEEDLPSNLSPLLARFTARKRWQHIPIASNIPAVRLFPGDFLEERSRYCSEEERLVVFFGFASPEKGVESLFDIADPATDVLVLISMLTPDDGYHQRILELAGSVRWRGRCAVTGHLPPDRVARLLRAADAAVFPFTSGMRPKNGSVLAALAQGTLVVTTSTTGHGYDPRNNIYCAPPGDAPAMREALGRYSATKVQPAVAMTWATIAEQHYQLYRSLIAHETRSDT